MATYYTKSTDVGAPTLSGTNGDLITVLDYCLVTTAGLTKLYSGTNKAVYQMSDTTTVMRVVHDSAVSGGAQYATVRFAESASGIDTLVDPFPTVAMQSDTTSRWYLSQTASATVRPWWCLIDTTNHALVFIIDRTSGNYISGGGWWFGGPSMLAVDNYASCGFTVSATQSPFTTPFQNTPTSGGLFFKRTRDGTVKSTRGTALTPLFRQAGASYPSNGPAYPHPDDGKMRRERAYLCDYAAQATSTVGSLMEPRRMWMPHIWVGSHAQNSYTSIAIGDEVADSAYDPSATFVFFPLGSTTGSEGALLLEKTDTWSAPTGF